MDLTVVASEKSVEELSQALRGALAKRGIKLFAVIDHGAEARIAGLDLPCVRLFLFGDPAVGTRLMQENPIAGIDLPLKVLVWEDARGKASLAYPMVQLPYLHSQQSLAIAAGMTHLLAAIADDCLL